MDLFGALDSFNVPLLNFNFIDIAIVIVILIYAVEGYAIGFLRATLDFISFIFAFLFALAFYPLFASFFTEYLTIPLGFSNAIGFFLAAFIAEVTIAILLRSSIFPVLSKQTKKMKIPPAIGRISGIVPGVFSAVVLLAFILTMVVALPVSSYLKNSVTNSKIGSFLVLGIQGFDDQINDVFGGAVNDALTFLTIEPASSESIKLNFTTTEFYEDREAEIEMLELVNLERERRGIPPVKEDLRLRTVARDHCEDMFVRGYFSHFTPEGDSPFDRMSSYQIGFEFAGENLALAPETSLAMKGLMNSPGHKENILSLDFGKVGIGVLDGKVYGKMYCQEFTD